MQLKAGFFNIECCLKGHFSFIIFCSLVTTTVFRIDEIIFFLLKWLESFLCFLQEYIVEILQIYIAHNLFILHDHQVDLCSTAFICTPDYNVIVKISPETWILNFIEHVYKVRLRIKYNQTYLILQYVDFMKHATFFMFFLAFVSVRDN